MISRKHFDRELDNAIAILHGSNTQISGNTSRKNSECTEHFENNCATYNELHSIVSGALALKNAQESVLGPGGVDPANPYGDKEVKIPGQDPYKQKRLPTEEIFVDSKSGKQIWVTVNVRKIVRKVLNLPKVRNVYLNMAISRMFAASKPKYSWRVNLRSIRPGEVGHIRYSSGAGFLRGGVWKMVAIEKPNVISIIWLGLVG